MGGMGGMVVRILVVTVLILVDMADLVLEVMVMVCMGEVMVQAIAIIIGD